MNNAIKIKDNIYWIGVNDRRTHISKTTGLSLKE